MRFFIFVALFFVIDLVWWLLADRLARRASPAKPWRHLVAGSAVVAMLGLFLLLTARVLRLRVMIMPEIAVICVYLWHFLIAPVALIVSAIAVLLGGRRDKLVEAEASAEPELAAFDDAEIVVHETPRQLSRRNFLYGGLAALPPVVTLAMTGQSKWTEDDLLRRDLDIPIKNLPPALDGMTIAHVTDPHIGSFISDRKIQNIIKITNEMDADLVLQTGDLINQSLQDLPDGIEMLRKFRGRYGVISCQGNHDCIDDRDQFEKDVKRSGAILLVDETAEINVRGQRVRLLGPRWWGSHDDVIAWSVKQLMPTTSDDAFNILMAHHPHAFDPAVACGIPLTLSGHTHGGQIALTRNIGVGPVMYRYWSGLYQNGSSTCFVSNGTGNWFPLRINVPCEILKLTLQRA